MVRNKMEEFEATAVQHLQPCLGLALRLTRSKQEAEDLVQETYLRAFRFFHRFEPGTNFKAWIFKILFNIFLNESRKKSVRREILASPNLEFLSERVAARRGRHLTNDPERAAINNQIVEAVQEALEGLPEEFRIVVHLSDIEGFTYKEISSIVGCPMGTVMSRLHRGRLLLREVLLHHTDEAKGGISKRDDRADVEGSSSQEVKNIS